MLFTASPIPSWICPALGSEEKGQWLKSRALETNETLQDANCAHQAHQSRLAGQGPRETWLGPAWQRGEALWHNGQRIQEAPRCQSQPHRFHCTTLVKCQASSESSFLNPIQGQYTPHGSLGRVYEIRGANHRSQSAAKCLVLKSEVGKTPNIIPRVPRHHVPLQPALSGHRPRLPKL